MTRKVDDMVFGLSGALSRRATNHGRLPLRADAGSGFYGRQQAHVLRVYLSATTFLFGYGVIFTLFPVRAGLTLSNPVGGIVAIVLGGSALAWLAVRPDKPALATGAAILATPIVVAFHRTMLAEFVCLIGPMFLAMHLRAFYAPRRGTILITVLTAACVAALAVAPAPKLSIDYVIFVVAIIGAAESFGLLVRGLVAAACTDPLTGLLNRAGWEIATADMLAGARSTARFKEVTVTVVAMDIDGLKRINDMHGHPVGDDHLITHADLWRRMAPPSAALARLGGDEFAACIVDGPTGAAAEQFVAGVRLRTPDTSIGTARRTGEGADVAALYAAADAELYAARRGKNPDTPDTDLRRVL